MKYTKLKYAAQECKDIRGLPPQWYDFDTLAITYGVGHTDSMFIAAASPDVVLRLIAERDAYAKAADDMAAAHKVERDAIKDAARLALDALESIPTSFGNIAYTRNVQAAIESLKAVL